MSDSAPPTRMQPKMQLIVAEKPSVARDIARVLGVQASGRQFFADRTRVITWCIGHLVELDEPASYDPRWKAWRLDTLPMLPERFKLRPTQGTSDQLEAVRKLLRDGRFGEVVNGCDAGREGELIFRYVYDLAESQLPIRRLWISSMTDEAIQKGFASLRPGTQYDNLADAARCRSEADWIVGLNATRAVTVRHRTGPQSTLYSIGRVQTPTLAIVVEREHAIAQFVPSDYWEVRANFSDDTGPASQFRAQWTHDKITRLGSEAAATQVLDRARAQTDDKTGPGAVVERLNQKTTRESPPQLFDLTSLQRTANRRFGLSANATLQVAQALYEKHKILTYPRTDSRYLSGDMVGELPRLFRGLARYPEYQAFVQPLIDNIPKPSKRVFDDSKVQDHHALIPTGKVVNTSSLSRDEARIFDLVSRRFVGIFYPDAVFAATELIVRVGPPGKEVRPRTAAAATEDRREEHVLEEAPPPPDRFVARGRVRLESGWQAVAGLGDQDAAPGGKRGNATQSDGDADATPQLPILKEGQRLAGTFDRQAKQTKPPPRHNEASLLLAMETAGRQIDDSELRAAMKDTGLGTPATRASIIETLLKRAFIDRNGKQLVATAMGMALIDALPVASLASPELTGQWEARLARIARGQEDRATFMRDIGTYVREVVEATRKAPVNQRMTAAQGASPQPPQTRSAGGGAAAAMPARATSGTRKTTKAPKAPKAPKPPKEKKPPGFKVEDLVCPRCKQGHLVTGRRGWGCSRWREGCGHVVWFERDGKRLTRAQLKKAVRENAG